MWRIPYLAYTIMVILFVDNYSLETYLADVQLDALILVIGQSLTESIVDLAFIHASG